MEKQKTKIAIISLTSCEGCQFTLLDLGERFLNLMNEVELVDFRSLEGKEGCGEILDVGIVEGTPITKEDIKTLKALRKQSKKLIVLGNCAAMGGVSEIKNYHEGKNTIKHVYRYIQGIDNREIQEVDKFVRVDFVFPGCPISGEEFLHYFPKILNNEEISISENSVCVECKEKGNSCLLLEKKACFGPMILGGCDAICPTSRMGCQGCRGLCSKGNIKAMRTAMRQFMTDEEFDNVTEIYGLRDDIEEQEQKLESISGLK